MLKAARLVLFIFSVAGVACAQIPTRGNIFAGYSYMRADSDVFPAIIPTSGVNFNGWEGSFESKFLPWIGVVADFGRNYCSAQSAPIPSGSSRVDAKLYTVLFGPRVSVSVGRFTPFFHGLFGVGHVSASSSFSTSDTSFAKDIGGGLDYKLIKGVAWRVQGDGLFTHVFGVSQDNFGCSTGIVLRFLARLPHP